MPSGLLPKFSSMKTKSRIFDKGMAWAVVLITVLLMGVEVKGDDAKPPAPATFAIQKMIKEYESIIARHTASDKNDAIKHGITPFIDYLEQLQNNWPATLKRAPHDFPKMIASLHETFQFYFDSRTNFEQSTTSTLLTPRVPLQFDKAKFTVAELHELNKAGIRLRLEWFNLLSRLQITTNVLDGDPLLRGIGIATQYLRDFTDNNLDELLTAKDFDQIMDTIHNFSPSLSDASLLKLADAHEKQFPGQGLFSNHKEYPDRYKAYKSMGEQFSNFSRVMYAQIWKNNPSVVESRATALQHWIENELNSVAVVLKSAANLKEGKREIASSQLKTLSSLLIHINGTDRDNVSDETEMKVNNANNLSKKDLDLVKEVNEYLCFFRHRFDVSCSTESKYIEALKAGKWKEVMIDSSFCNPAANLDLPLDIFIDYVKSHPADKFKDGLKSIRSRIKTLRNLASQIKSRAEAK